MPTETLQIEPLPRPTSASLRERWRTNDVNYLIAKLERWRGAGRPQEGVNHILALIHMCKENCADYAALLGATVKIEKFMAQHCAETGLCPTCGRFLVDGECPRLKEIKADAD